MIEIIAKIFIAAGAFFTLVTGIALLRFPDFYSRMHAVTKGLIGGAVLIVIGLLFRHGFSPASSRLIALLILLLITNPAVSHSLARAAYYHGLKPDNLIHDDLHNSDFEGGS